MNQNIYEKIAKMHGVTVEEVKREMQAAIDAAYESPTFHAQCVNSKGDKPTPEEFISHIVRRIQ